MADGVCLCSALKNKFVHIALQTTLRLVSELRGAEALKDALEHGLDVVIAGGNDFYSQRAKVRFMSRSLLHAIHIFLLTSGIPMDTT